MIPYNLTDMEVHLLVTRPWIDELSPVYLKQVDDDVYREVPLLRQMLKLLAILEETGGLKLTSIGNMPAAIVRELYALGVPEWDVEEYYKTLNSENKCFNVRLARAVLTHLKLVRRYNGKLVITNAGKAVSSKSRELLLMTLNAMCTDFNIGIFDRMDEMPPLTWGSALLYISVSKYGDQFRDATFYKDEYKQFLPAEWASRDFIPAGCVRYNPLTSCIRCRILERQLLQLGLVEMLPYHHPGRLEEEFKKTALFDKLIGVRISRNEALKYSGKIYS